MIRSFISYYKPYKGLFIADLIASLLVAAADLFYPTIARRIINEFVPDRNLQMLILWALILLGIYAAKLGLQFFIQYMGHVMGTRMQGDMRRDLFVHLQKLPLSFFDENKTGTIMSRIIYDLFDVSELAHHGPENLFLSISLFIGSFVIMIRIHVGLALIIFAFVPAAVLFSILMRSRMNRVFKRTKEQIAEVNAEVEASVSGIRVSRAYVSSRHEIERFDRENKRFVHFRSESYKAMGQFHSGMEFLSDLLYLTALTAGGLFFFNGQIEGGDLTAFILYITMLLKPIRSFTALVEQMQDGMTGFQRFLDIMNVQPEDEPENPVEKESIEGHIRFDHVTFRYENAERSGGRNVVDDLCLDLPAGKTVALVGPSGGGKTTLCHLIPRFYEISGGSISLDGTDIRDYRREDLRKAVGIVAQDVFLFNCSVRENIAYGKPDATDEEIEAAAKKANIDGFIRSLEHGYDTNVGERGVK
ncbi:MAG: ABC transporter ATP-binding protein, partial [Clostridia bacterium]|nr:ABC transporter ATP-binding protein [Clostridia bacterium]